MIRKQNRGEFRYPETSTTAPTKEQIRRRALAARDAIPYSDVLSAAVSVREHVRAWQPFRDASCVCGYVAVRSEMSTAGIILRAMESGKTVIIPKVFGDALRFFRIRSLTDDLERGSFGLLEPREGCEEVDVSRAGVCLIPGVAFDERGNRLGYGKGFYDRFLRTLPPSVPTLGLAYDCQVFKRLPAESSDVPVRFVVTPSRGVFATQ